MQHALAELGRALIQQNLHLQQAVDQNLRLMRTVQRMRWGLPVSLALVVLLLAHAGLSSSQRGKLGREQAAAARAQEANMQQLRRERTEADQRAALHALALAAVVRAGAPEGRMGDQARRRAVALELAALLSLPRTAARDREISALRSELVADPITDLR